MVKTISSSVFFKYFILDLYRIHISFDVNWSNNSKIRPYASVRSVEVTVATSSNAEMYIQNRYSVFDELCSGVKVCRPHPMGASAYLIINNKMKLVARNILGLWKLDIFHDSVSSSQETTKIYTFD